MKVIESFKASLFNEGEYFTDYIIRKHEPTGLEFASVKGEMYGVILSLDAHPKAVELNANLRKLRKLSYCV